MFPDEFRTEEISTNGTTLYVRVGGNGPAVLMLHGFGDTGDMWAPAAAELCQEYTVIVPDLRGMGLSAHSDSGYTKKNQALDILGIINQFEIDRVDLVTHNIGSMVGYAFASQFSNRVKRWVAIDTPLPGLGNWENFNFGVFTQDAKDNQDLFQKSGKLTIPVLAVGAEKSFGKGMEIELRTVASRVEGAVVPHSGHWVMAENPKATTRLIVNFLSD